MMFLHDRRDRSSFHSLTSARGTSCSLAGRRTPGPARRGVGAQGGGAHSRQRRVPCMPEPLYMVSRESWQLVYRAVATNMSRKEIKLTRGKVRSMHTAGTPEAVGGR
jgi:hypothetical protein